jgi:hypothetical protein
MEFLSSGFEANRIIRRNERNAMLQRNSIASHFEKKSVGRFAALILSALLLGSWFAPAFAQQPGQRILVLLMMPPARSLPRCKRRTSNFR